MTRDEPVAELLERLVPPSSARPDWDDVVRRVTPPRRRRLRLAAGLALAAAVLAAMPALGLGGPLARLFASGPPKPRIEVDFSSLEVGHPKAFPKAFALGEIRLAARFRLPGGRPVSLWVAATRRGDRICWLYTRLGSTCAVRSRRGSALAWAPSPGQPNALAVNGQTFDDRVVTVELVANGRRHGLRFVWVGPPIAAGFFAGGAPGLTATFVERDASGRVLRLEKLSATRR